MGVMDEVIMRDDKYKDEAEEWFEAHLLTIDKPRTGKPKKKKKDLRPSEYEEQKLCVKYLKKNKIYHWSTPNEAERSAGTMMMLQMTGLKKGVADLTIMLEDKLIFIEMKRQQKKLKNGKVSKSLNGLKPEQEFFNAKVNKYNYCEAYICNGYDEFKVVMDKLCKKYNKKGSND